MTLDGACETLTDGGAGHVDLLAGREHVGAENGAGLEFGNLVFVDMELFQRSSCFNTSLSKLAGERLVDARGLLGAERDLNSIVAVGFNRLDAGNTVAGHVEHRHGNGLAVLFKDARHADLTAD